MNAYRLNSAVQSGRDSDGPRAAIRFASWTQTKAALRAISALSVAGVYGLWWWVTSHDWVKPLFLPRPAELLAAASDTGWHDLLFHVGWTLLRVLAGFLTGACLGVLMGMFIAYDRRINAALNPLIESWRPVPPVALMPFFILWFGFSYFGQWLLISLGCALVMVVATSEAVHSVRPVYVRAALSLGARKSQVFVSVVRPAIMPALAGALRVALALSISLSIVSEFMGADWGIGNLLDHAVITSKTQGLMLYTMILGFIAWMLDTLLRLAMLGLTRWAERREDATEVRI